MKLLVLILAWGSLGYAESKNNNEPQTKYYVACACVIDPRQMVLSRNLVKSLVNPAYIQGSSLRRDPNQVPLLGAFDFLALDGRYFTEPAEVYNEIENLKEEGRKERCTGAVTQDDQGEYIKSRPALPRETRDPSTAIQERYYGGQTLKYTVVGKAPIRNDAFKTNCQPVAVKNGSVLARMPIDFSNASAKADNQRGPEHGFGLQ